MRKIVTIVKTFSFTHPVYVYEDENVIFQTVATVNTFDQVLYDLSKEYETSEVEMYGAAIYTKGLKNKIEKAELTKYNQQTLNITLK